MPRRSKSWAKTLERTLITFSRLASPGGRATLSRPTARKRTVKGQGDWVAGMSIGLSGARRFRLFKPPGMKAGERLPVMVMLHGCGQDAESFAISTRMNRLAARERFLVLYPEQDRLANHQRCWNWYDTRHGRAYAEVEIVMNAVEQACFLHGGDRSRVVVAGLSAGASLAGLIVTRHPTRFRAVVMHSGVPPGTADSTAGALRAMHRGAESTPAPSSDPWPPLLVIHGTRDRIVSTRNAQAAAEAWAEAAGARAGKSRTQQRGQRYAMAVTDYKAPRGRTVARLVEIDELGHAWSGGSDMAFSDPRGPDASRLAWSFASALF